MLRRYLRELTDLAQIAVPRTGLYQPCFPTLRPRLDIDDNKLGKICDDEADGSRGGAYLQNDCH